MLIGAHVPTFGDYRKVAVYAAETGCECVQVFSNSPRTWAVPPMNEKTFKQLDAARLQTMPWPRCRRYWCMRVTSSTWLPTTPTSWTSRAISPGRRAGVRLRECGRGAQRAHGFEQGPTTPPGGRPHRSRGGRSS